MKSDALENKSIILYIPVQRIHKPINLRAWQQDITLFVTYVQAYNYRRFVFDLGQDTVYGRRTYIKFSLAKVFTSKYFSYLTQ